MAMPKTSIMVELCCVKKDNLMIDEATLVFMRHFLIDYYKPNMDKHCLLSFIWCITELFEGSSYSQI